MESDSHHLYVHVPFCRLVCAYCDFVTVGGRARDVPRYTDAVLAELAMRPAPGVLRTVYFGGGTPSLLDPSQVARIVQASVQRWGRVELEEVTLEANPSGREAPDWTALRQAGVTRISLGVQSLRDQELATLARGHSGEEASAAYRGARAAAFDSVSVDLIYGIPGQSLADWHDGLERVLDLAPDHVSCYALQLALAPDDWAAPPRPGALRWRRTMAARQDDGLAAAQYQLAEELLGAAGFEHYELSSWARPGHLSRHNAAYWDRHAYTGVGAGAHSYDGTAERSWNARDLDEYLTAVEAGGRPVAGAEILAEGDRAFEAMALGLRRIDGVERTAFALEFGTDPLDRFAEGLAAHAVRSLIETSADRLRLTAAGRLMASEACLAFLPG